MTVAGPALPEVDMAKIPIQLSEASGVPFYRQIEDQIAQFIRSGQLPAGSRVPSVRELASQLLVSLITVRRSYADLEQAGLLERRQGQGTFIAPQVQTASRARALAEARELLTEAVVQARHRGMPGADIVQHVAETVQREENQYDNS